MASQHSSTDPGQMNIWDSLQPFGTVQTFRRHSYIHTPSQPAHALYLLQSGQISLQMFSSEGRVLTIKVVGPESIFGYSAIDGSSTYDTYAEALKTAQVLAVPRDQIFQLLEHKPALGPALIDLIVNQQRTVKRRIEEVAFKSVPARLASVLLEMSQNDDPNQPDTANTSSPRMPRRTHQQLAEMINAYRETVTKVINQFREAHLLDIDRSEIRLLNLSRLRELSQS
jgi:CRP-like cAMP-binding protein